MPPANRPSSRNRNGPCTNRMTSGMITPRHVSSVIAGRRPMRSDHQGTRMPEIAAAGPDRPSSRPMLVVEKPSTAFR